MSDPTELLKSVFDACASNIGPMVGIELSASEFESPVTLCSPLHELATLGRRMAGEDDPDQKVEELSAEHLDAIGEVLNLMSGGVDQALREHLDANGHPGTWWRTDDPGEESFEAGEFLLGQATLAGSEGTPVHLYLRVSMQLFEGAARATPKDDRIRRLGLIGLPEDVKGAIESALADAGVESFLIEREDPHFTQSCARATMLIVGEQGGLEVCKELRTSNETWPIPTVSCLSEPTSEGVLAALDHGASHVLRVPFEDAIALLKVISGVETDP